MSETVLKSATIMQPADRNRHNFMIFGGFLLKHTFELAFCCAASLAHARPNFLSLDPSTFENPVPVGSVLYLRATVAYTEPLDREFEGAGPIPGPGSVPESEKGNGTGTGKYTKIQVRVDTKVRDVEHGTKKATGMFSYTFLVEGDVRVMPRSYSEYMVWTDARRRAKNVDELNPVKGRSALRSLDSVTE